MRAILFLIIATTSWGLNFHLAKVMMQNSYPLEAGFWRYLLGVATLVLFTRGQFPIWQQIRNNLFPLFKVGFIGLFGFNVLFFLGLSMSNGVNGALIVSLNPALTLVFSHFILKTSITLRQILGIVTAFGGAFILISRGHPEDLMQIELAWGDLLIFAANIVFALHNVWVKQYSGIMKPVHFTLITNFLCLLGMVLIFPFQISESFITYSSSFWLAALGIGAMGTAVAYYLWNRGVAELGAPKAGIFMNMVPLSAAFLAPLFGEAIQGYHIVSGAVIILGLLIMQTSRRPDVVKASS